MGLSVDDDSDSDCDEPLPTSAAVPPAFPPSVVPTFANAFANASAATPWTQSNVANAVGMPPMGGMGAHPSWAQVSPTNRDGINPEKSQQQLRFY